MAIIKPEYQYSEETGNILAAAFEVHSIIGCGFLEKVYHRALEIEFRYRMIPFTSEREMQIYYKNHQLGGRRVDLFVYNRISVELKAVAMLDNTDLAQAINYLQAFRIDVGLLINFGSKKMEFRRLINPRLLNKNCKKET
jgi:GxxExxY protein